MPEFAAVYQLVMLLPDMGEIHVIYPALAALAAGWWLWERSQERR